MEKTLETELENKDRFSETTFMKRQRFDVIGFCKRVLGIDQSPEPLMLPRLCKCGCGGVIKSKNPNCCFLQGHALRCKDAKQKYIETCRKKYGVSNVSGLKEIMEKRENTSLKKYGVKNAFSLKEFQTKAEETNYKKYGVKHALQCQEFLDKCHKTTLEHHGTIFCSQIESGKLKSIETNLKRHGVKFGIQKEEFKKKRIETTKRLYKVNNVSQLDFVKEKQKKTWLKTLGVEHPSKCIAIKEKKKKTCYEHFGVTCNMQTIECRKKSIHKYTYQNLSFDSAPELALYIYLTDNKIDFEYQPDKVLTYTADDGEHKYFPDFRVENDYWEIKGEHFFENEIMIDPYDRSKDFIALAKFNCMKENGIKIIRESKYFEYIRYVEDKYGKNYLKQFKNCQRPQCG